MTTTGGNGTATGTSTSTSTASTVVGSPAVTHNHRGCHTLRVVAACRTPLGRSLRGHGSIVFESLAQHASSTAGRDSTPRCLHTQQRCRVCSQHPHDAPEHGEYMAQGVAHVHTAGHETEA